MRYINLITIIVISILIWKIITFSPIQNQHDVCIDRAAGMANHQCYRWQSKEDSTCIQRLFDGECIRWTQKDGNK